VAGGEALRDAITAANSKTQTNGCVAVSGNDTIQFSVIGTIVLASTFAHITGILTINGPASPGITVDGGGKFQGMRVAFGATLNLNNVTISNGFSDCCGGGIFDDGTVNVTASTFSGNEAVDGAASPSTARLDPTLPGCLPSPTPPSRE